MRFYHLCAVFNIARKILFLLPAETAHYFTMNTLKVLVRIPLLSWIFFPKRQSGNSSNTEVCGISFPNKVGLAAGFDKNADYLHSLSRMGFGHIEVGTVTPVAQSGNPKPRLFRLPKDQALINRMGFNNLGVDHMVKRLKNKPKGLIIGGNIGKNKVTPNEEAVNDYLICLEKLFPYVDYFTVNVSSPNTPGLRELQDKEPLTHLLKTVIEKRDDMAREEKINRPIFLKIAPDMHADQIKEIAGIVEDTKTDGVIVSNTTIDRKNLSTDQNVVEHIGAGGLSGAPVFNKSNNAIRTMRKALASNIPIIGVGGIMDDRAGKEKMKHGANLIQIYTGFIYGGIGLIKKLGKL